MAAEVIGPTFRKVILALSAAAIGAGTAAATNVAGRADPPDPQIPHRLSAVETTVGVLVQRGADRDARLERIETKLDRLLERK